MKKFICILILILNMGVSGGCRLSFFSDLYPSESTVEVFSDTVDQVDEVSTQTHTYLYVHVCGAVKKPGLYSFRQGDRIDAAIRSAGGFTKAADEQSINLAEPLVDGVQIYVKSRGDTSGTASESQSGADNKDGKVNINKADKTELMTLNGIGEGRALSIIEYREQNGSFSSIEDICEVGGIGEAIYNKIKNKITVE